MVSLPTMLATAGRSGCDAVSARLCSTGASGLVRALVDVGGEVIEGHELHGLVAIVEGRHRQGDPPACLQVDSRGSPGTELELGILKYLFRSSYSLESIGTSERF